MTNTWTNNDGLYIKYGTTEATPALGGEIMTEDGEHKVVISFGYDDLAAYGTTKIMADNITIPAGAILKSATVYVETAFSTGSSPTLTIGTIDVDRSTITAPDDDADGIDATIAASALSEGATVTCDGALIGATLGDTVLITMLVGTANFSAGRAKLTITWYIPDA